MKLYYGIYNLTLLTTDQSSTSRKSSFSPSPINTFGIPKTRSGGNLAEPTSLSRHNSIPSRSPSFDQGLGAEPLANKRYESLTQVMVLSSDLELDLEALTNMNAVSLHRVYIGSGSNLHAVKFLPQRYNLAPVR